MVHMTTVSVNTSKIPHIPWTTGSFVSEFVCTVTELPSPASLEKTPLEIPFFHGKGDAVPEDASAGSSRGESTVEDGLECGRNPVNVDKNDDDAAECEQSCHDRNDFFCDAGNPFDAAHDDKTHHKKAYKAGDDRGDGKGGGQGR